MSIDYMFSREVNSPQQLNGRRGRALRHWDSLDFPLHALGPRFEIHILGAPESTGALHDSHRSPARSSTMMNMRNKGRIVRAADNTK